MTKSRLLLLLVLGLAGYAALLLLFPKYSPAARWRYTLDRPQAIAKARATAERFGIDASQWQASVITRYQEQIQYYLEHEPEPLAAALLTPLETSVIFYGPTARRALVVDFNARGQLHGLQTAQRKMQELTAEAGVPVPPPHRRGPRGRPDQAAAEAIVPDVDDATARQRAEAALQELLGGAYPNFEFDSVATLEKGERRFTWTAPQAPDTRLKLTAEALLQGTTIKELLLRERLSPQFRQMLDARRSPLLRWLEPANAILLTLVALLAFIIYLISLGRREIKHRLALTFLGVLLGLLVVTQGFGPFLDGLRYGTRTGVNSGWVNTVLLWLIFALTLLMFALPLYLAWAAGQAQAARLAHRRTAALELLLRGQVFTRHVAASIVAGLLLGGVAGALPLLLVASGLFPGAALKTSGVEDLFTAFSSVVAAPISTQAYTLFLLFGFLTPLLAANWRRRWLAQVVSFIIGLVWLAGKAPIGFSAAGALAATALLLLLLDAAYRHFDLLAVLVTSLAAQTALSAAALLAQPSASLQTSGWRALLVLAALLPLALVGMWKGRETPPEFFAAENTTDRRAERERLKAEFDLAARAQQQMLPDAPPVVPGFDIAAVCRPAKEVGGDLYDFLQLPDGKLGIVVADVSGKGVPAALYMTLTKGLLASVAEDHSDPGEILREVNRHLYDACRRKVFVTLFLGVLDPATRTLTYARAGHNPTVWRSPERGTTELLKAPGLGLGLNQGGIFNRTLKVAQIKLAPADALFFYSDGLTEAMNATQEEYGEERLLALAAQTDGLPAARVRDTVLADVGAFLGAIPPQDDQTLVVVRVAG